MSAVSSQYVCLSCSIADPVGSIRRLLHLNSTNKREEIALQPFIFKRILKMLSGSVVDWIREIDCEQQAEFRR